MFVQSVWHGPCDVCIPWPHCNLCVNSCGLSHTAVFCDSLYYTCEKYHFPPSSTAPFVNTDLLVSVQCIARTQWRIPTEKYMYYQTAARVFVLLCNIKTVTSEGGTIWTHAWDYSLHYGIKTAQRLILMIQSFKKGLNNTLNRCTQYFNYWFKVRRLCQNLPETWLFLNICVEKSVASSTDLKY